MKFIFLILIITVILTIVYIYRNKYNNFNNKINKITLNTEKLKAIMFYLKIHCKISQKVLMFALQTHHTLPKIQQKEEVFLTHKQNMMTYTSLQ